MRGSPLVVAIIGAVAFIVLASAAYLWVLLLGERPPGIGVTAPAEIVDKTETTVTLPASTRIVRCVDLRLTHQGAPVTGSVCGYVWPDQWDDLAVGDQVQAIYLPESVRDGVVGRIGLDGLRVR